jgi:protein gp37
MAENTKIEWCDHTWNPWIGCTQVSPACDHCYAMTMMDHRYGRARWGAGEDRVRTSANNWNDPLRWERRAAASGRIETVFCLSLGDIWDNEVDPIWRRDAFAMMERTPHLLYLLLSKRVGNAVGMCNPMKGLDRLPPNAALGATMVNQEEWDRDIPKLVEATERLGARFSFVSVEPMLGPINMHTSVCRATGSCGCCPACLGTVDWVICGGESGPGARAVHPDWVRGLRDQCARTNAPFFFKQWGDWVPAPEGYADTYEAHRARGGRDFIVYPDRRRTAMELVGKKRAGALLDGREWRQVPA